ncbi:Methylthioribose-1-phosphate isomerase [Cantharellus anzutake]|uniref:Methylthioribose-1-phosphate isomerase n=1 Tax=Cantharellus anzutake TaxID=1750568 RepID=UPI001905F862|nr:Methylthioribose-1-phosphate isomerase [Cantharellus anzutake]KAF8332699.1 Methylthioribose-1-phosphate isomerase [Cantharellus anzutake]
MSPLSSLRTDGDKIEIINQLLLPHTTEWLPIDSVADAYEAIKSMKIRGAPAIASLASLSIAQNLSRSLKATPPPDFLATPRALQAHLNSLLDFLFKSRPTAVNLGTAIRRLRNRLGVLIESGAQDVPAIVNELIKEARLIADEDLGRNKEMSKNGADWLLRVQSANLLDNGRVNILTVCNTGSLATSGYGTALGLITRLFETGKLNNAYYTQTAPYHQGSRLTSYELVTMGAPSVMICDTMVGSLFQHVPIHAVAVGADRIAKNGDTANKIGTYNAAVLASRHKIPFIVVAPVSTVDLDIEDGSKIPIEHRPPLEACLVRGALHPVAQDQAVPNQAVVMLTPANIDLKKGVYNPSFDVTPAELIAAIVTEKGVATKTEGSSAFDLSTVV